MSERMLNISPRSGAGRATERKQGLLGCGVLLSDETCPHLPPPRALVPGQIIED